MLHNMAWLRREAVQVFFKPCDRKSLQSTV
jgi:hypothetical protein